MKKNVSSKALVSFLVGIGIWAVVATLIFFNVLPRSYQSLATKICYYIILTVSLDLIVGFLGDLSLGHAAFYAVGAYAGCAFAVYVDMPFLPKFIISLLVGGLCAAIVGFLVSIAVFKLRGDYLAIVTLAFGEFIRSFVKIIPGLGGTSGLTSIPSFSNRFVSFTCAYAVMALVIIVMHNLTNSRHGRAIMAIRDNAIAAESVGINIKKIKALVFAISSFMAGMAGVILGFYKTSVTPSDFDYNVSIEILVMVVLGGMGSIKGSIIASIIIVALPDALRGAAKYRLLIYAIALITMMMLKSSPKVSAFKDRIIQKVKGSFKKLKKSGN